nr:MAG TPA: hypothetical protein [Caudoviricetes sp.]
MITPRDLRLFGVRPALVAEFGLHSLAIFLPFCL